MLFLQKPSVKQIDTELTIQAAKGFTYPVAGITEPIFDDSSNNQIVLAANGSPEGYVIDHNRVYLGKGEATFERAKEAVRQWEMFNLGWAKVCWLSTIEGYAPIEVGITVAVVASIPFWSLNPCQIVYTLDETVVNADTGSHDFGESHGFGEDPTEDNGFHSISRFGFGYGTLPGHIERGEERFQVEWHSKDDTVWYDILALSQPNLLLAKVGYPVVRHFQKRFARDSKRAMVKACEV